MPKDWLPVATAMFPVTKPANVARNLPFVLAALRRQALDDPPMVLVALATIRAETEGFVPISEYQSKYNTTPGRHAFNLYDTRRDLGNSRFGDGAAYRGRGYVQLTGRDNYERIGARLKLTTPLIDHPEQANDPSTAADILAIFLKDREAKIRTALKDRNLGAIRKLVNGGSHGLARFTDALKRGEDKLKEELPDGILHI